MDLNAAPFLFFFLPFAVLLYWLPFGRRYQNIILVLASLIFYAFGQLKGIPILLGSFLVNWLLGKAAQKAKSKNGIIALAVLLNIGVLFFYKYLTFTVDLLGVRPANYVAPLAPIGVSFFTFKALSYVIDVAQGGEAGSFLDVLIYISFFPQITSGPITRYKDFGPQLKDRTLSIPMAAAGFRRFVVGLGKKLLLSGSIAAIANAAFTIGGSGGALVCWLGALAYTLQLYFDFSGYSDMSIGLSAALGFVIPENFQYPYMADSLRDFWKRWHISLSSWFQTYLYIPLGGGKKGMVRKMLNQFIVFTVSGLWHGASLTFLAWGAWHGIWSAVETACAKGQKPKPRTGAFKVLGWVYTMLLVVVGFVFFRADSIGSALSMLGSMFTFRSSSYVGTLVLERISPAAWIALIAGLLACVPLFPGLGKKLEEKNKTVADLLGVGSYALALVLFAVCLLAVAGGNFQPFIYNTF